ncbi:MAG: DUF4363 family protein [Clostridiales bacterium]|nr:DUF4363 family protein [Clostridiales bacterium]
MKRVPAAITVLLLLFIMTWINCTLVTNLDKKISSEIEVSKKAVIAHDYDKAYTSLQKAQSIYLDYEGYFGAVVKHSELDTAVLSFARLFSILEVQDKNTFCEESSYLIKLFEHIGDMECLSLRNVL